MNQNLLLPFMVVYHFAYIKTYIFTYMMFSDNLAMLCHESMSVSGNVGYGELPS